MCESIMLKMMNVYKALDLCIKCICSGVGIAIKNVELHSGEISVNVCNKMLHKRESSSYTTTKYEEDSTLAITEKSKEKKQAGLAAISKHVAVFPEKVWTFSVNLLYMNEKILPCFLFAHVSASTIFEVGLDLPALDPTHFNFCII